MFQNMSARVCAGAVLILMAVFLHFNPSDAATQNNSNSGQKRKSL